VHQPILRLEDLVHFLKVIVKITTLMSATTHTDLGFVRERINDIGSALFFSQNTSVLRLPATVVTALTVDEVGQIWFFISRPTQSLQEFDREFPARLDFYRKGKQYFLQVAGRAFIVNDPEEINQVAGLPEDIISKAMDQLVLVKFKIVKADYFSSFSDKRTFSWKSVFSKIGHAFLPTKPEYRPYYYLELK
jgi:general stress protein 26